jgi:hypothetical protein
VLHRGIRDQVARDKGQIVLRGAEGHDGAVEGEEGLDEEEGEAVDQGEGGGGFGDFGFLLGGGRGHFLFSWECRLVEMVNAVDLQGYPET